MWGITFPSCPSVPSSKRWEFGPPPGASACSRAPLTTTSTARGGGRAGAGAGPLTPLCLVLQAQLSEALEELGGQKQRADMVSPETHALLWVPGARAKPGLGRLRSWALGRSCPHPDLLCSAEYGSLTAMVLLVIRNTGTERAWGLGVESWRPGGEVGAVARSLPRSGPVPLGLCCHEMSPRVPRRRLSAL